MGVEFYTIFGINMLAQYHAILLAPSDHSHNMLLAIDLLVIFFMEVGQAYWLQTIILPLSSKFHSAE